MKPVTRGRLEVEIDAGEVVDVARNPDEAGREFELSHEVDALVDRRHAEGHDPVDE